MHLTFPATLCSDQEQVIILYEHIDIWQVERSFKNTPVSNFTSLPTSVWILQEENKLQIWCNGNAKYVYTIHGTEQTNLSNFSYTELKISIYCTEIKTDIAYMKFAETKSIARRLWFIARTIQFIAHTSLVNK